MKRSEAIVWFETACFDEPSNYRLEVYHMAIDALRYQESTKCSEVITKSDARESKWISVEDRLPEENQRVILYIPRVMEGGNVRTGWLEPIKMWFTDGRDRLFYKQVTHWMPMPEPPENQ